MHLNNSTLFDLVRHTVDKQTSTQKQNILISTEQSTDTCLSQFKKMEQQVNYQKLQQYYTRQLERIEQQISDMEDIYLKNTKRTGNILTGFTSYVANKCLMVYSDSDPVKIKKQDKIFSLSSVTSPVHSIPNRLRQTRRTSKIAEKTREKERITKEEPLFEEYSVESCYSRDGSLNKHPQSAEKFGPKYRSEGDRSRTVSQDSHFNSMETEEDEDLGATPIKKMKIQSSQGHQRRKSPKKGGKKRQRSETSNQSEMCIQSKEQESALAAESSIMKQQVSNDGQSSCDSVELFMRMATPKE